MQTEPKIFAVTKDLLLMQEFEKISSDSGKKIFVHNSPEELFAELEKKSSAEILLLIEISGSGREGIRIAEAVKEKFSSTTIIAYSKLIAPDTIRRAKNAGIKNIITQDQLITMLPNILERLPG